MASKQTQRQQQDFSNAVAWLGGIPVQGREARVHHRRLMAVLNPQVARAARDINQEKARADYQSALEGISLAITRPLRGMMTRGLTVGLLRYLRGVSAALDGADESLPDPDTEDTLAAQDIQNVCGRIERKIVKLGEQYRQSKKDAITIDRNYTQPTLRGRFVRQLMGTASNLLGLLSKLDHDEGVSVMRMHVDDACAHLELAQAFAGGRRSKIEELTNNMETSIAEALHGDIYDFVFDELVGNGTWNIKKKR